MIADEIEIIRADGLRTGRAIISTVADACPNLTAKKIRRVFEAVLEQIAVEFSDIDAPLFQTSAREALTYEMLTAIERTEIGREAHMAFVAYLKERTAEHKMENDNA
jgi:hypothetical protein